jgi:outer membrane protein TolC
LQRRYLHLSGFVGFEREIYNNKHVNCRKIIFITAAVGVAGLWLAGCSTETYRQWADRDVNKLLSDRKDDALGYQPKTPVDTNIPKNPPAKRAYAKSPETPIPPPQPPAVEPSHIVVPFAPLGPELKWMRDWPAPSMAVDIGVNSSEQEAIQRLRLGPPSPFIEKVRLDLFGALQYGIQHSRQYQDQLESLYLSTLDVTLQRHLIYDPHPFVSTSLAYAGGQQDIDVRSALTATANAGVTQRLPYGGQVVASALVSFVDALNHQTVDGESAQLALSGSIPLLRGAGLVNLEPLINSERTLVYQVRGFEDFRRTFVVNVASQYFNLQARLQSVNNRRLNLANTQDILTQTEALFAANRISFLEVQRSRQALLQAQTNVISAQTTYGNSVDDFKLVLGMPVEQDVEIVPVALEVAIPDISSDDANALAERYRLSLQTARDRIDDSRRNVSNAENGLLPDLSLTAASSVGNRLDTPAKELDSRTLAYSAGLKLDLPVDRLAERNAYRAALLDFAKAQRDYVDETENVRADVRTSLRQIRTAQLNIQIQRRAVDLAQRRLEYSTLLLQLGTLSSNRDLVDAQTSLLSAQDAYEQAKSDLQVNVLQYLRNTGTLRVDPKAGTLGRALNMSDDDLHPLDHPQTPRISRGAISTGDSMLKPPPPG